MCAAGYQEQRVCKQPLTRVMPAASRFAAVPDYFLAWPGGSPPGFLASPGGRPPGFLASPGGVPPDFASPGGAGGGAAGASPPEESAPRVVGASPPLVSVDADATFACVPADVAVGLD